MTPQKFIKLPLIQGWTYERRPCDSKPILAKNGILVNLDRVKMIQPFSDYQTTIDDKSVPCSFDAIQAAWANAANPITDEQHLHDALPYHPYWEGKFSKCYDNTP